MTTLESTLPETADTSRTRLRFAALSSGLAAALINAAIARVLMRIVALIISGRGGFSIGGTLNIFMIGALMGPLFGAAYGALHDRLPGKALVKGVIFAVIMVFVFQLPVLLLVPEFRDEVMANGGLGLAVFGLMNLLYSLTLAAIYPRIRQRVMASTEPDMRITIGAAVLTLIAVVGAIFLIWQLGSKALELIYVNKYEYRP